MALSRPFGKSEGTLRASTTFGSPGSRAFFALFARVKDLSAMATACWEMDNASLSSSALAVASALIACASADSAFFTAAVAASNRSLGLGSWAKALAARAMKVRAKRVSLLVDFIICASISYFISPSFALLYQHVTDPPSIGAWNAPYACSATHQTQKPITDRHAPTANRTHICRRRYWTYCHRQRLRGN